MSEAKPIYVSWQIQGPLTPAVASALLSVLQTALRLAGKKGLFAPRNKEKPTKEEPCTKTSPSLPRRSAM